MKPPLSEEKIRAYHRSLDEQRRIEGARALDAADRWVARRGQQREIVASDKAAAELRHAQAEAVVSAEVQQEILKQTIESGELRLRSLEAELRVERGKGVHEGDAREETVRRDVAQSPQALNDTGGTSTLVGEASPFYILQ